MILMEKGKMVLMIFISIFTFILIISILALIGINLQKEESIPREKQSYDLTEKEIDSLTTLISNYDSYLIIYDGMKDIDDLTDLDKINFIDRLPIETKKELELDFNTGVSLDKIKSVLKKYFGKDVTFEPVNSTCYLEDGDYLIYDEESKMYKADNLYHSHSAYTPPSIINFYVSGKRIVDNDKLVYTITLKKALSYDYSNYYRTYTDLISNNNKIVNLYDEYNDYDKNDIPDLLEDYKDNLNSYTYVFETKDSINNSYLKEYIGENNDKNI